MRTYPDTKIPLSEIPCGTRCTCGELAVNHDAYGCILGNGLRRLCARERKDEVMRVMLSDREARSGAAYPLRTAQCPHFALGWKP